MILRLAIGARPGDPAAGAIGAGSTGTNQIVPSGSILTALKSAGVIFVDENGEGAGARLKKPTETGADLTGQIDALKADMTPEPDDAKPRPKPARKQLRRAHDQNELLELKNRRSKLRTQEKK